MDEILLTDKERKIFDALVAEKLSRSDLSLITGTKEEDVTASMSDMKKKGVKINRFRGSSNGKYEYWIDSDDKFKVVLPTKEEMEFGERIYAPVRDIGEAIASREVTDDVDYHFSETIGIIGIADTHIGHPASYLRMTEQLLMHTIPETDGLYCILMGDLIDNSMNAFAPSGCFDIINKDAQLSILEYFLTNLKGTDKILAWCEGNHEYRSFKTDHFRPIEYVAKGHGGLYCKHGATFGVNVDGHRTEIYASHMLKGGSQFNPLHPNIRAVLFDKAPEAGDADVIWRAHTHESAVGCYRVSHKDRIMLVCGCTVAYDEYADRHGFTTGISSFPVLILRKNGDRLFFKNTMDGIRMLKILRRFDNGE